MLIKIIAEYRILSCGRYMLILIFLLCRKGDVCRTAARGCTFSNVRVKINKELYRAHLKVAQEWGNLWYLILESVQHHSY